jgi:tricorn protease
MIALSTAALAVTLAQTETAPRLMRFPDVHGSQIVFTYAGDLWISSLEGGPARQLTSSPGLESNAKFSPDGKHIAFTAQYEGASDVYVVSTLGGQPKRLTFDPENDAVLDWTPDGRIAYASTAGNMTNRQPRLWFVSPEGGLPMRSPIAEITQASFFSDGKRMAYNRQSSFNFNWRRYRGGSQGKVSLYNFETNSYSELPTGREQNHAPMVIGETVYYISDRNQATLNLYKHDLQSKKETQLTKYTDADIKFTGTDGKTIVFERDGRLFQFNVATEEVKPISPVIRGELQASRPFVRNVANQISSIAISPSGQRLIAEARGELFSVPAKNGDTRNLTNTSASRERFADWAPDGKTIAYAGDETGYYEVYVRPQMGGEAKKLTSAKLPIRSVQFSPDSKQILITTEAEEVHLLDVETQKLTVVTKHLYGGGGEEFSPDSRWIVWQTGTPNDLSKIQMYEIATGKVHDVTSGKYLDANPTFDQTGRYLYLTSVRTFAPSFGIYEFSLKIDDASRVYMIPLSASATNPLIPPSDEEPESRLVAPGQGPAGAAGMPQKDSPAMKVDLNGMEARMIPLPLPASTYRAIGLSNGVLILSQAGIVKFDLNARESVPIGSANVSALSLNASRTKMAYAAGNVIGIADIRPGFQVGQGRVETSAMDMKFVPRDEWKQIFWEAWRYEKFNFYDPNMLGLNWDAIGKRYEKYLEYVHHRSDLSYVLGLMLGELGTGHAYVQGGDFGPGPQPLNVGHLGADYETSGEWVRFKKILKGDNFDEPRRAPLGEPGIEVREGDYLLEIDGEPVNKNVHPNSLLLGKAGRFVTLTINSTPVTAGARKMRARTVSSEQNLRYIDFVESCRKRVEEASGGRIGYMHIPNTQFDGSVEFVRGFYSQTDKDAVIVDERWNGGGYIQPWFVDTLARTRRISIQQRNTLDVPEAAVIEGPKAMLINGYAGSGGDFFPWMFRRAKLGPLIGTRTWGGLVGIAGSTPLVDGGGVTAPEFSLYNRETNEIIAENTGIDPDIEVDADPSAWAKGKDPQLERAIQYLLEELKKQPAKPKRTTIPAIEPKGRVKSDG